MKTLKMERFQKSDRIILVHESISCTPKEAFKIITEDYDIDKACKVMITDTYSRFMVKPVRADELPVKWLVEKFKDYAKCILDIYYADYELGVKIKEIKVELHEYKV